MIISRTPFRISFAGGGTDLAEFYKKQSGAVVSTAIDKFMYVTVNRYFNDGIILKYSKTELVEKVADIKHPILRECLRHVGIDNHIEITSAADVVGGTGLGSSSSFTVGVLHALYAYKGEFRTPEQLAREACEIEIKRLRSPIGKQDQYIAAYGGFQFIEFIPDETVRIDPLIVPSLVFDQLADRLVLLYTGVTRKSSPVLRKFRAKFTAKDSVLKRMRELSTLARRELQLGQVESLGEILHEGWELKKSIADGISNTAIDSVYETARNAGAVGGKILGAGGGGFLLLFVPPRKRKSVLSALRSWREIPFKFEPEGSKIIYVSR